MLSSVSMWLFTVLLIVVAFTPDVVIRVGRKHWASIIVELRHIGRSFNKKMKKEAFLPQKTYDAAHRPAVHLSTDGCEALSALRRHKNSVSNEFSI